MKLLALAGGGALLWWLWPRDSKAQPRLALSIGPPTLVPPAADEQVSSHFKLSEFLQSSKVPELARYRPTAEELTNLKALAGNVLEPLRLWYGPIRISGGGRPQSVRNAAGRTITEELARSADPVEKTASAKSDHVPFAAADAVFIDVPPTDLKKYAEAWQRAKDSPHVRQVILETVKDKAGAIRVSHLHLAAVTPTLPRLPDATRALIALDGKVIPSTPAAPSPSPALAKK